MKKLLLSCLVLTLLGANSKAQFLTATIDGVTDAGYATGADSWALGWDDDFLYIRKNTSTFIEPTIIYLDHNPIVPVSGGGNSDGNLIGVGHWGITPTLPFRADFTIYWEDSYLQYQTANGSGGWNAAVTIGTPERTNGIANKECRIPWSAIRGVASPPAAFNWFGYNNSRVSPGFIYHPTPVASNPTGVQASPRFFYYNSIVNTTNVGTTNPFALNQISLETRGNYDFTAAAYAPPSLWDMTINAQSGSEFLAIDKSIEIRNRLDIASPFSNLRPMGGGTNMVRLTLSGNQGSVRLSGGNTFGQFGGNIMELEITGNVTLFSSGNFLDFRNFIVATTGDLTANNVQMSSNSVGGTFTINGILRTSRTEGLHGANDFTIRSNNIPTITIGANSRIVYNNSGSQTVTTTANYANLEIAGSGLKTINGNTTVNGQLNLTAGTLSMGTSNLTVGNGVTGTGLLSGSASSNLSLTGGTSTLNFATGGTNNFLRDLTLSGAANVTLGNTLNITGGATPGTVSVSGTAQLNTGGHLVLKSDANGTARVAPVTSSAIAPILGEVTVERFIPQAPNTAPRTGRAWRLLSFPVTGSSMIWQAWGNGADPRVSSLDALNVPDPVQTPGIGTLITGHAYNSATGAPPAGNANAAGYDWWGDLFDIGTGKGASTSIRRFTPARNNGNGDWLSNTASRTTAATILTFADPAYMLFVRGDRTVAVGSGATTLAPKGFLRVGDVTTTVPVESPTAKFFTYGNPYASTLDFGAVYFDGVNSGLLKNIMHVWDANLAGTNGLGGYRSVSWNGIAWVDNIDPSATNMQYIQSGQGVLLESDIDAAGYTMFTRESHKVSGNRQISPFAAVTPGSRPMLYSRLYLSNHSGETNVVDGAVAGFNEGYSLSNDDAFDHSKPLSITGNLALGYTQGGKLLSFEGRPLIQDGDILYLQSNGLTATAYTIEFEAKDLAAPGRKAYLKDKFLGTETEIPLTGEKFRYGFEGVSGQEASTAADRFEVVFKVSVAKWIVLTGRAQRPNIILDWKVPAAGMFKTYIIQQSGNNIHYRRSAIIAADANAGEQISHILNSGGGVRFFRVQGITHNGETITSNEVLIGMNDGTAEVTVSPNPAISGSAVSLLIENLERANYNTTLLNANGAPVTNMVIRHDGRNQVYQFQLPANLAPGTYYIQVRGKGGNIVKSILIR